MNGPQSVLDAEDSTKDMLASLPDIQRLSLHVYAQVEEARHKWIMSERAGYDLGEQCIKQWIREHWSGYLRARWLEHLQGRTYWIELQHDDFGILPKLCKNKPELLEQVLNCLRCGGENLNAICWSIDSNHSPFAIQEILHALNLNSARILHRFEAN